MLMLRSRPTPATRRTIKPRPLMPLSAVMWRLDCHECQVLALIEEGELLWAFDVKAPKALRPSVRVLTQSLADFLAGKAPPLIDEEMEWERVAKSIFPPKPIIAGRELARLLNCGRQHVLDLVHAGQLGLAPRSQIRPGPGGMPQILTPSAAAWLRTRRML